MKGVLECGDWELPNNLSEQMMRSVKTNVSVHFSALPFEK
jgi:hypothetical protein